MKTIKRQVAASERLYSVHLSVHLPVAMRGRLEELLERDGRRLSEFVRALIAEALSGR